MRTRTALAIFAFFGLSAPTRAADEITVASPDGRVQFRLSKHAKGSLTYTVTLGSKAVIEPSKIGIVVDKVNLSEGVELGKADAYRVNTTYPWNGPHSMAVDKCNGVKLAVLHSQSHSNYTLEVRA